MTDQAQTNQITDVTLDMSQVVTTLGSEIGILSTDLVVTKMKLQAALQQLTVVAAQNENLRKALVNRDTDLLELRKQVASPNHPIHRAPSVRAKK